MTEEELQGDLKTLKENVAALSETVKEWTNHSAKLRRQRIVFERMAVGYLVLSFVWVFGISFFSCARPETWLEFAALSLAVVVWLGVTCVVFRSLKTTR